jgi:hypothetical protein
MIKDEGISTLKKNPVSDICFDKANLIFRTCNKGISLDHRMQENIFYKHNGHMEKQKLLTSIDYQNKS